MKNILLVDLDSDREQTIQIKKPGIVPPQTREEFSRTVLMDMATLCEAVCTLMHLADREGIKPSAESLRACIEHLTRGFADADYRTITQPPDNS